MSSVTTGKSHELIESLISKFVKNEIRDSPSIERALDKAGQLGFLELANQNPRVICQVIRELASASGSFATALFTHWVAQEILAFSGVEIPPTSSPLAYPVFSNPLAQKPSLWGAYEGRLLVHGKVDDLPLVGMAQHCIAPAFLENDRSFSYVMISLGSLRTATNGRTPSLGIRLCPLGKVIFDGAECTLLGSREGGEALLRKLQGRWHLVAASLLAGIMGASLKEALNYSRHRIQGGRKIIQWSDLRMSLAQLSLDMKATEMILAQAISEAEARTSGWQNSAIAAMIHTMDRAGDFVSGCLQVFGGLGYMKDHPIEARYRDAFHLQNLLGSRPQRKLIYFDEILLRSSY